MSAVIHIAAALLLDDQGRTLLVRKRGTTAFMQPGGKLEPGEPPVQALLRELHEELGLRLAPEQARFLGQVRAPAVNEPGFEVCCELFEVRSASAVAPAAEIAEARWVTLQQAQQLPLAPLTRDEIFPRFWG